MKIKICGITNTEDARVAVDSGADLLGFIIFPGSKRYITPSGAGTVAASVRGRVDIVAVLINPDDALIAEVEKSLAPDFWQLHGEETSSRCMDLAEDGKRKLIKAVGLPHSQDFDPGAYPVDSVGAFLMDKA